MTPTFFARPWLWGTILCLAWSGCNHTPPPTIMGKWRWAGTWHAESGFIPPDKQYGVAVHEYKPDSTYSVYDNGKLTHQNQPFAIRRGKHPDGKGQVVDFMISPDETIGDKHQLVWIKGKANDTLIFMLLDPQRSYHPYVYSTYVREQ